MPHIVIKPVLKEDCDWLNEDLHIGQLLYRYYGPTWGCIGPDGVAMTFVQNTTPFFEVPKDCVAKAAKGNPAGVPAKAEVAEMGPPITVDNDFKTGKDGRPYLDSRTIAERFGKRHDNVIRDIEALTKQDDRVALNFEESFYESMTGNGSLRKFKCYKVNRDGFTLLGMGFNGPEALKWKIRYIEAFNQMEARLATQAPRLPTDPREQAVYFAKALVAESEAHRETKGALVAAEEKVVALQVDADAMAALRGADGVISIKQAWKTLTQNDPDFGMDEFFAFLWYKGWIFKESDRHNWEPYQSRIDAGYMVYRPVKGDTGSDRTITRSDGVVEMMMSSGVTPRGMVALGELLAGKWKDEAKRFVESWEDRDKGESRKDFMTRIESRMKAS